MGKVGPEFLAVKAWQGLAPYVTRCALSPLFPVPYIEEARQQGLKILGNSVAQQKMARFAESAAEMARNEKACRVCEALEKTKKCSGCEKVYYCGRECQRADWKAHKSSCRQEKAAV
jgi:xylose isomerase